MESSPASRLLLGFLGVIAITGCQPENYRWQTVIHEDGSVTRSISQPRNRSSQEVVEETPWERLHTHPELTRKDWPRHITPSLFETSPPLSEASEGELYLLAEGTFKTLDQIPEHYHYQLPGTELVSELKHNLLINDYGLVKEYIWTEQITDVVVYEKIPAARRETIELIVNLIKDGLQTGLGEEYEVASLIEWVKAEGNQMLEELTMLILSPDMRTLEEETRKIRFEEIVRKYDMAEMSEKGFESFLRLRLQEGIQRKDGKPLDDKTISMIIESLKNNKPTRVSKAIAAATEQHCGDKDETNAKLAGLMARQVGIHAVPMMKPPHLFDVWIKLPGELIETNGTLDDEDFVGWSFSDEDIWPTGYQMTARSLFAVKRPQVTSLDQSQLKSRSELLSYFRIVSSDPELKEIVKKCLTINSLHHLETLIETRYKQSTSLENGEEVRDEILREWNRAKQLLEILDRSK